MEKKKKYKVILSDEVKEHIKRETPETRRLLKLAFKELAKQPTLGRRITKGKLKGLHEVDITAGFFGIKTEDGKVKKLGRFLKFKKPR
jgi:hypothetical protein